jgi:anti-anti-sigma regulatory factor
MVAGDEISNIRVERRNPGSFEISLSGEFDLQDLGALRAALEEVANSEAKVMVDLAGVTFLDLGCARQLAASCRLCGERLTISAASWQAMCSLLRLRDVLEPDPAHSDAICQPPALAV